MLTAWGRQGEVVSEYLSKGSPVFLEGSLKFDTWEAEDGTKRSKLSVTAFRIQLIGGRRDGDEEAAVIPMMHLQQHQWNHQVDKRPHPLKVEMIHQLKTISHSKYYHSMLN